MSTRFSTFGFENKSSDGKKQKLRCTCASDQCIKFIIFIIIYLFAFGYEIPCKGGAQIYNIIYIRIFCSLSQRSGRLNMKIEKCEMKSEFWIAHWNILSIKTPILK